MLLISYLAPAYEKIQSCKKEITKFETLTSVLHNFKLITDIILFALKVKTFFTLLFILGKIVESCHWSLRLLI